MTNNDIIKATDNEIIKALEDWMKNFEGKAVDYMKISFALDLINRQKAEIEALKAEEKAANHYCKNSCEPKYKAEIESITEKYNCQQTVYADLSKIIKDKNAEIERLEANLKEAFAEIEALKQINLHCKAEAVKEFAEILIDKAKNGVISIVDLPDYVREKVGKG